MSSILDSMKAEYNIGTSAIQPDISGSQPSFTPIGVTQDSNNLLKKLG